MRIVTPCVIPYLMACAAGLLRQFYPCLDTTHCPLHIHRACLDTAGSRKLLPDGAATVHGAGGEGSKVQAAMAQEIRGREGERQR
jgi:hypothetical protein